MFYNILKSFAINKGKIGLPILPLLSPPYIVRRIGIHIHRRGSIGVGGNSIIFIREEVLLPILTCPPYGGRSY
jgi:hypothetical protein